MPGKIKFNNVIYEYDKKRKEYINYISDCHCETLLYNVMNVHYIKEILEIEVELIEDKNEIDIQNIEEYEDYFIENSSSNEDIKSLARKCNDLIKAVKQLDIKINGKE